ncbi:MAG: hypothetical protein A3F68_07570 [Acidobacteria bacterium RIFCSPLOWO2_12_FULL_54_10]|nr:MAG: hypothetical protein A3F68_07570 [Acidobacteria bacterium RIFCSPLOWO2_12_FULL_54_10]
MNNLISKITLVLFGLFIVGAPYAPAAEDQGSVLRGSIRAGSEQNLEGFTVSAKADGSVITTTVYTDAKGQYVFPTLPAGKYRVWAQAVGFAPTEAQLSLDGMKAARQDLTLNSIDDFSHQLTGTEWMAALPEDTTENKRMKMIFRNNCAGCHQPNFVLQSRFDEAGWRKIIDVMERVGIYGDPPRADGAPMPLIRYYKDEMAAYLAKMRGPGPSPMKFKPFPRPSGEAARVVITEYDVTTNSDPSVYPVQDGALWEGGVPSAYESRGVHDAEVDSNGIVWIADSQDNPVRTAARLDPKTGEITNFKLDASYGMAKVSHGIVLDKDDFAWFNADNGLGKINTRTNKMDFFEVPKGMPGVGGTLDVDDQGMVWAGTNEGAIRFNSKTNEFTAFASKSKGSAGRTYGIAVDSTGNAWWAQMNYNKIGVGNTRNGEVTEVAIPEIAGMEKILTPKDIEVQKFIGSDWNSATLWHQGPRRLGADKNGTTVWIANSWGDQLSKIDIKTHKVTQYPYPSPGFGLVYDTTIDKNGMVWINLMNADRVARFDPKTEKWTEFSLPSIGTENRFIAVDNYKTPVEVWVPYWRTNRLARMQFRTEDQIRAALP